MMQLVTARSSASRRNGESAPPSTHSRHWTSYPGSSPGLVIDCKAAPNAGSFAFVVQVDGLRNNGTPHGSDIYDGLIPRFVSSCSAADPGRYISRAGAARTRLRHHLAVPKLPTLRFRFRPGPQPLHAHLGRPALAGTQGCYPGAGTALPLAARARSSPSVCPTSHSPEHAGPSALAASSVIPVNQRRCVAHESFVGLTCCGADQRRTLLLTYTRPQCNKLA